MLANIIRYSRIDVIDGVKTKHFAVLAPDETPPDWMLNIEVIACGNVATLTSTPTRSKKRSGNKNFKLDTTYLDAISLETRKLPIYLDYQNEIQDIIEKHKFSILCTERKCPGHGAVDNIYLKERILKIINKVKRFKGRAYFLRCLDLVPNQLI